MLTDVDTGEVWFDISAADHWGVLEVRVVLANGTLGDDSCFNMVPDDDVDQVITELGYDPNDHAKGIVIVGFDPYAGGESASISQTSEFSFVFDDQDSPSEGSTLLAGGRQEVIFGHVNVGTTTVTLGGTAGGDACALESTGTTNFPVVADYVTEIDVLCE